MKGMKQMKRTTKLLALLLALVLTLSLATTAFAAQASNNTITVNKAKAGETYNAYKMLELVVDDVSDPKRYAYTVAAGWANFFDDTNKAAWEAVLKKDDAKTYFEAVENYTDAQVAAFAEAAAKYVTTDGLATSITDTPAEGETSATLNTTTSGYYLVTSTLGTIAMIDTTPGDVTINEKNGEDTITKTVKEDSTGTYGANNDAQVGDTVEFKSEATIVPRSVNVKIHDTMGSGLTLDDDSIHVYTDEALTTEYTGATINTGANAVSGDTFTIVIPDDFAAAATEDQKLYITYSAKLNANAVVKDAGGVKIVDQKNKTKVTFGASSSSVEAETTTTTHKFTVHKYATGAKDTPLANAIFELKKDDAVVNLKKLDDNNYRVVDAAETGAAASHVKVGQLVETIADGAIVKDFVTVASGDIVIWGVDADSDYKLYEIQTPKGYNMINQNPVEVSVSADTDLKVDVENKTGSELPSTGGVGTALFYVVGGILVVCAGVLLVAKRRMAAEK